MGDCLSSNVDDNTKDNNDDNNKKLQKQNRKNTKEITKYMQKEERNDLRTVKILFLGPGGSGKSTIFKQLKCLHCGGFSSKYARQLKSEIYVQIISQMKTAIKHYYTKPIANDHDQTQELIDANESELTDQHIETIRKYEDLLHLTDEIAQSIQYIWKHCKQIQEVFQRNDIAKKVLDQTTPYFWDSLDRICASDFIPNEQDIINMRFRTTGMLEMKFQVKTTLFWFVDVGGQKNERRKWIQHFKEVSAVIFVVDLSSFNELMFEDKKTNCMDDTFNLFEKTLGIETFDETPFVLFLNKTDLFEKKIPQLPITLCPRFDDFEDYKYSELLGNNNRNSHNGDDGKVKDYDDDDVEDSITRNPYDYEQTTNYISQKFTETNAMTDKANKALFIHYTCAMNRESVNSVFGCVQRIVLSNLLASHGTY